ncbi:hypothetical protein KC367_g9203 [Hortaea werneckii]|nr:hypothetical protein KC367_g9203 [Hortaea werneckii]
MDAPELYHLRKLFCLFCLDSVNDDTEPARLIHSEWGTAAKRVPDLEIPTATVEPGMVHMECLEVARELERTSGQTGLNVAKALTDTFRSSRPESTWRMRVRAEIVAAKCVSTAVNLASVEPINEIAAMRALSPELQALIGRYCFSSPFTRFCVIYSMLHAPLDSFGGYELDISSLSRPIYKELYGKNYIGGFEPSGRHFCEHKDELFIVLAFDNLACIDVKVISTSMEELEDAQGDWFRCVLVTGSQAQYLRAEYNVQ